MDLEWGDPVRLFLNFFRTCSLTIISQEPVRPGKQRALSLWDKLRHTISVLKPFPGTLPTPPRRSNSDPRGGSNSHSHSHSRSSSNPQHQTSSKSYQPRITVQTGHRSPPQVHHSTSHTKGHTQTYAISPGGAVRRSTQPPVVYHHSTTPRSPQRSGHSTPVRPTPRRSATSPSNGVMYNGKLIVGSPKAVDRYISSQRRIENWVSNVP